MTEPDPLTAEVEPPILPEAPPLPAPVDVTDPAVAAVLGPRWVGYTLDQLPPGPRHRAEQAWLNRPKQPEPDPAP